MERLQKVMAEAGVASRRASEKIIAAGRVRVNGQVVTQQGVKVGPNDEVLVDGVPLSREKLCYYLLNKPRGVISSASDDKGRRTVVDILREQGIEERVYPVGRLDYDTTGALIMTNDGALAERLMHPKYEVPKEYVAKVKGVVTNHEMSRLRRGISLDHRHRAAGAKTKLMEVSDDRQSCIISLTIHEGHYHQVKRMLKAVGHPVMKLHRERYGFLDLHGLNAGEFRALKPSEVRELQKQAAVK